MTQQLLDQAYALYDQLAYQRQLAQAALPPEHPARLRLELTTELAYFRWMRRATALAALGGSSLQQISSRVLLSIDCLIREIRVSKGGPHDPAD